MILVIDREGKKAELKPTEKALIYFKAKIYQLPKTGLQLKGESYQIECSFEQLELEISPVEGC